MLVQRQADVRGHSAVAILIVRPRVVGIDATGADRIIEDVDLTVAGDCLAKGVIGSAFLANRYSGWSAPLCRKNLDHAGERTWTVDGALRTAGDFDSADVVRREVGKIELTGQSLIDRNAIEQDLHVLARQSAHEDRRQLPRRSGLDHIKARDFAKSITDALDLFMIDILRIDHAHAGGRSIERNVGTRR